MQQIQGTLEHIIFRNEENGYTVAKILERGKALTTTIVGVIVGVEEGEELLCEGSWKNDKRFGKQFSVQSFEVKIPSTTRGIEKYLASGAVAGLGTVLAKRVVDKFGEDTLQVLDMAPHKLQSVEGIGKKKLLRIQQSWSSQKDIRLVMIFLQTHGVSPAYAQRIFKKYQHHSIDKVKENPYRLATDIAGIGFKKADAVAQQLGIEASSPQRIDAGIEYVLQQQAMSGHTCLPEDYLTKMTAELLGVSYEDVSDSIHRLTSRQRVLIKNIMIHNQAQSFVWLQTYYDNEHDIALEIDRLLQFEDVLSMDNWEEELERATKKHLIALAVQQEEAVVKSIENKIHIITGGPGTGKSTITKIVLELCLQQKAEVLLAAPTGRAAKRLSEITKKEAYTLHSLLIYDFTTGGFRKNHYDPFVANVLIVDEASMIDTPLMVALLRALPDDCKLILVGDIDQLPSVGAGNVLADLIVSKRIPVTKLTEIFRQSINSKIVTNAHKVNQGIFPDITTEKDSDFFFISEQKPERIIQNIYELIDKRLPKAYRFQKLKDIQLLCPMNKGAIGSHKLNRVLQSKLNPNKKSEETGVGHRKFVQGDKVIQLRNNYDKGIFNGDIGFIKKVQFIDKLVTVEFDNQLVDFEFSELMDLELAYAVSVHKYQGSESPCIILPIHPSYNRLLYRNLVYTGITRGKKLVILIGSREALNTAIKNDKAKKRYTGLSYALSIKNSALPPIKIIPMLGTEGYEEWIEENF